MEETTDGLVLDCSVTMAWCFDDEATPFTESVQDRLIAGYAVVPAIWPLEVANAALMGERRKRLDEARTSRFFALLVGFPITVDDGTGRRAFGDIAHLARAHRLTTYDASYLELAIRSGVTLATLDERLRAAASAVGVRVFDIH